MFKILKRYSGVLIIVLFLLPPIYFWYPFSNFSNLKLSLLSIGQISSLLGFILLSINFILSTRLKIFENLFNGLNRMYIVHHFVGITSFSLIISHPILIISSYLLSSLTAAFNLIIPSSANIPVFFGSISLFLMIVLMVITLFIKIKYNIWKSTHKFMGITLLLSSVHILLVGSTVSQSIELKNYIIFFIIAGVISYLYYTILGKYTVSKKEFVVTESTFLSDNIIQLSLKPINNFNYNFKAGQFVFIKIDSLGVPKEFHPFSVVAEAGSKELKLGIKILGDYTNSIKLIKNGDAVLVEGPYGRFGSDINKKSKQIWIAGGIGITPFVSMVKNLNINSDVVMIYSFKSYKDAVYKNIFEDMVRKIPSFKFLLWNSSINGRLTADNIVAIFPDSIERNIYICGPNMLMIDLKKQLIKKGVSSFRIFTEEFSLN